MTDLVTNAALAADTCICGMFAGSFWVCLTCDLDLTCPDHPKDCPVHSCGRCEDACCCKDHVFNPDCVDCLEVVSPEPDDDEAPAATCPAGEPGCAGTPWDLATPACEECHYRQEEAA